MGIMLGFLCIICFLLLFVKGITRRFHFTRIDSLLMRLHKPLSVVLVILCTLHIAFVIPVIRNRNVLVSITGIVIIGVMLLLIWLCHRIQDKKKKMWWHRVLSIIMVVSIVGHILVYYIDFVAYKQKVENTVINEVDLLNIKDGIYEGEYDVGYIYAKVEVEISAGKIVSVTLLEHRNERGKTAEVILDEVLKKQKIDVDAVSGATNSSKVIKKAMENAIQDVKK